MGDNNGANLDLRAKFEAASAASTSQIPYFGLNTFFGTVPGDFTVGQDAFIAALNAAGLSAFAPKKTKSTAASLREAVDAALKPEAARFTGSLEIRKAFDREEDAGQEVIHIGRGDGEFSRSTKPRVLVRAVVAKKLTTSADALGAQTRRLTGDVWLEHDAGELSSDFVDRVRAAYKTAVGVFTDDQVKARFGSWCRDVGVGLNGGNYLIHRDHEATLRAWQAAYAAIGLRIYAARQVDPEEYAEQAADSLEVKLRELMTRFAKMTAESARDSSLASAIGEFSELRAKAGLLARTMKFAADDLLARSVEAENELRMRLGAPLVVAPAGSLAAPPSAAPVAPMPLPAVVPAVVPAPIVVLPAPAPVPLPLPAPPPAPTTPAHPDMAAAPLPEVQAWCLAEIGAAIEGRNWLRVAEVCSLIPTSRHANLAKIKERAMARFHENQKPASVAPLPAAGADDPGF